MSDFLKLAAQCFAAEFDKLAATIRADPTKLFGATRKVRAMKDVVRNADRATSKALHATSAADKARAAGGSDNAFRHARQAYYDASSHGAGARKELKDRMAQTKGVRSEDRLLTRGARRERGSSGVKANRARRAGPAPAFVPSEAAKGEVADLKRLAGGPAQAGMSGKKKALIGGAATLGVGGAGYGAHKALKKDR